MKAKSSIAVLTSDPEVLDQVLSSAAAAGVDAELMAGVSELRSSWATAVVVVVGIDRAAELARVPVRRRPEVYLVGAERDREELVRWSVPLGAAVVVLPSGAADLTGSFASAAGHGAAAGRVVAVMGGSGGVGASTCAAALAVTAARRGVAVVLIDADPWGGGIDLLLGAEGRSGWRWPKLAGARGHVGDLSAQLPDVEGVQVLSASRASADVDVGPDARQLAAVLASTTRSHGLSIVDLPRGAGEVAQRAAAAADLIVLVVRGDVRGVAAARQLRRRLDPVDLGVLVRTRRSGSLLAGTVGHSLSAPVLGVVPDDLSLRLAAERGEPPSRSGRGALARVCGVLLDELLNRSEVA